eukprot:2735677-Prorocentrum_lima.AAC.1
MARYDLLRAVAYLASCVTKWTVTCDQDLHQLICYIKSSLSVRLVSWCGDHPDKLGLVLYADADFAGCHRTNRSTSGVVILVQGPNTRC